MGTCIVIESSCLVNSSFLRANYSHNWWAMTSFSSAVNHRPKEIMPAQKTETIHYPRPDRRSLVALLILTTVAIVLCKKMLVLSPLGRSRECRPEPWKPDYGWGGHPQEPINDCRHFTRASSASDWDTFANQDPHNTWDQTEMSPYAIEPTLDSTWLPLGWLDDIPSAYSFLCVVLFYGGILVLFHRIMSKIWRVYQVWVMWIRPLAVELGVW